MRASDRAYAALRREILDGDLRPGTLVGEVEHANRLGVSRTPVREALARLAADGLVAPRGARGVVVTEVATDDVRDLFCVRAALEAAAARLAARRRDAGTFVELELVFRSALADLSAGHAVEREYFAAVARLDAAIDEAAANSYLVDALAAVRTQLARVRRQAADDSERLADSAREHLQIIEAILEGSESLAADATNLHLAHSLRHVLATMGEAGPTVERGRQRA